MKFEIIRNIIALFEIIRISFAHCTLLFASDVCEKFEITRNIISLFEHILELKINLTKSSITGMNVESDKLFGQVPECTCLFHI